MPIIIKNRNIMPTDDYETVDVLGLSIPLTDKLPFGGQVELLDAQALYTSQQIGQFEWLMRVFCIFTRRLPKSDWVRYDWLSQQALEPSEITDLLTATTSLLTHMQHTAQAQEKSAGAPKKARGKATPN